MYFHASSISNLKVLMPHVSNHGKSLVYFSSKRENVLVYLSNAIEKLCKEKGFPHSGSYHKWGSYGFDSNGILVLEEYYPNATVETYQGVSGYIYSAKNVSEPTPLSDIPFVVTTPDPVFVDSCEYIADAYEALLDASVKGEIIMRSFDQNSEEKLEWIRQGIVSEYRSASDSSEYQFFLENKFPELISRFHE